jgi:16S rRNA (guanine527-N7)-methyltransferase
MTAGRPANSTADDRRAVLAAFDVSRETAGRLDSYVALLNDWQRTTNLVAPSTLPHLWTRHIADSLQLLSIAGERRVWADLGSGGGFPGVVLACALAGEPGARVHLVERNGKKAAFLREAIRVTGAAAQVHPADIGDFVDRSDIAVDCVTARALAPLKMLLPMIAPLVGRGARALLLKGQDVEAELTEATKYWNIELKRHASRTGDGGCILDIVALTPARASRQPPI